LARCRRLGDPAGGNDERAAIGSKLLHWQTDPDLVTVRDSAQREQQSAEVRQRLDALWQRVAAAQELTRFR
jgi:hypothetical protein